MRPQAQARQRECTNFAVFGQFLIRLEALERIDRVILPIPICFAVEIAAVGERALDLGIALRIGMKLITGAGRLSSEAPGGFLLCSR
jgi:hypothetical protein